jgi:hypothetical protein
MSDTEQSAESDDRIDRIELEKTVKKWVKLDDDIRDIEHNLKEKKKLRQQYEEELLKIDDDFCINITGGKLTKSVLVRKAPIQEKLIKDAVAKTENDPQKIKKFMDDVEAARELKQKKSIKRIFDRAPKK